VVIFRKRKLLEKQKKRKTHETSWNVEIPQEAFMAFKAKWLKFF
jgi:translation elongation factor EF-4